MDILIAIACPCTTKTKSLEIYTRIFSLKKSMIGKHSFGKTKLIVY